MLQDEVRRNLDDINEVDRVESQSIAQLSQGFVRERPWVWLRRERRGGQLSYVPHISLDGAYELFRRISQQTPLCITFLRSDITDSKHGIPVISIIVGVRELNNPQKLSVGGQDAFMVIAGEEEELRAHGTAQALHKALRNAILNYIHLYVPEGEKLLREFIDEAISQGKAAIIERGGQIVPLPATPQEEEIAEIGESEEVTQPTEEKEKPAETPPEPVKTAPPPDILEKLMEISPRHWGDYLLIYAEIVAKDPTVFTQRDWEDFIKWCRSPISQSQIDDLLHLIRDYMLRKEKMELKDRREEFSALFKFKAGVETIPRERRITELTQPEYHILRQKLVSEIMALIPQQRQTATEEKIEEEPSDFPF